MEAFGDTHLYAVFSDSLEVYVQTGPTTCSQNFSVAADTISHHTFPACCWDESDERRAATRLGRDTHRLSNERYLTPINDWATAHHTRFVLKPTVNLVCRFPAIGWLHCQRARVRSGIAFSYTRWATSASHLYGRPITSAETWTWAHSACLSCHAIGHESRSRPLLSRGVNQLIGTVGPTLRPASRTRLGVLRSCGI